MFNQPITPVVKNLMIINVLVFVVLAIMQSSNVPYGNYFPLSNYYSPFFKPFQVVTNMFTHFDLSHMFFNMLTLYFFGPLVEQRIGEKKTLIAYLFGGLLAGLIFFVVYSFLLPKGFHLLGASGSIFTIVILAACYFPEMKAGLLFIPVYIPLKYFAMIFVAIDLFMFSSGRNTGIAHLAHLGGVVAALILFSFWKKR